MRRHAKNVEENSVKLVRDILVGVVEELALSTPVLTGRARANWQARAGSIPLGEVPVRSARETVDAAKKAASGVQVDGEAFIANYVPYIGDLNRGSSAKAAAGFVDRALIVVEVQVRAARLLKEGSVIRSFGSSRRRT